MAARLAISCVRLALQKVARAAERGHCPSAFFRQYTKEPLIYLRNVIPATAEIQQPIKFTSLDSGSALRSARNDELIRASLTILKTRVRTQRWVGLDCIQYWGAEKSRGGRANRRENIKG